MSRLRAWIRTRSISKSIGGRKSRLRLDGLEDRSLPSFVAAPSFPVGLNGGVGSKPVAIVTGDFNGDGALDVATANQDSQYVVSVLLGNGDGTFQPSANINIGRSPSGILAVDLNKDSKLDLVTANKADNSVSVLLGNGDGTFQLVGAFSTGAATSPVAVAAGDFNGDTNLDLAVADNGSNIVSLLTGDGTGQLAAGGTVTVGSNPTSVAVADFNNDNHPDIASVSGGFGYLNINLNNGDGTFAGPVNYATGFVANTVVVGDFNEDGQPDVAVACNFPSGDGVSILLGNPNGTFQNFVNYNAGNQTPATIAVVDLNGDGHQDLVTANGQFGNNSASYLQGTGTGTFATTQVFTAGQGPVAVAVGDLNGDGRQDIVTADSSGSVGTVSILIGNGDGTVKAAPNLVVSGPGPIAADYFTGDGKIDLAVVTTGVSFNGVTIFPGLGTGAFASGLQTPTITQPTALAVGDFNRDGKQDLAVTGSAGVSILLGNGNGTFAAPQAFAAGASPAWVITADFNRDGKPDLAVANNSGTDGISILLGNGDGTFGSPATVTAGGSANYVVMEDFNHDGLFDLAVLNGSANKVSVVFGAGDGTFGAPSSYATRTGPGSVSAKDLNGDGIPDLAVPTFFGPGASSAWTIWVNNGTGSFTAGQESITGSRPIGSAIIDYNGDAKPDVVTANNFADSLYVFNGNYDGTFGAPESYVVGDRPTWVIGTDFNADGKPDLAVVNSNSSTVTLLTSVTPIYATHLEFNIVPDNSTAGDTFQMVVTAKDDTGNVVPSYTGLVNFGSDNPADSLPDPYQFTTADAGTRTFDVSLTLADTHTITVSSALGNYSDSVDVTPAAADHFEFDVTTDANAGDPFDTTLTLFDPYDNLAAGYRGAVHLTTNDPNPGVTLPADYSFTAQDAGSHTFTGGVTLLTAGARTLTANLTGLPSMDGLLSVHPAAASRLTITAPGTAIAGVPINVAVTAWDPYDNHATGFLGTVHLGSSDLGAALPGDYTFTSDDQGSHNLQVTLKKAGAQSVNVSAPGLTGDQMDGIQVSPAAGSNYAFIQEPTNTFVGIAMKTPISVQLQDSFGNPVAGLETVTLGLANNPTRAKLRNATALTDGNGFAVFPSLRINKMAPGYTLIAQGQSGVSVPSAPFTVYQTTHFKITVATNKVTAGTSFNVTVTALDRRNQPDKDYRGTVHFSSSASPLADLPADYTFQASDNGQHTFTVTLNKAGAKRLVVSDMQKPALKRTQVMIVAATDASAFLVTGVRTPAKVNATYSLVVTAVDRFGNKATNYTGTVQFSTNGNATLPPAYTFTAKERGRHVFKVKFLARGAGLSLTVTDQSDQTIAGTESGITVV